MGKKVNKKKVIDISKFRKASINILSKVKELVIPKETKDYIIVFSIVYFCFVVWFGVIMFRTEVSELGNRIEQSLSYIILFLYPLFDFIILKTSKKKRVRENEVSVCYTRQFPDVEGVNRIHDMFIPKQARLWLWGALFILLISIVANIIEQKYSSIFAFFSGIHGYIITNESLGTIIGIVIGVYAFLIALVPLIVEWVNRRCIFFEAYDLPIIKMGNIITIVSFGVIIAYFLFWFMEGKAYILGILEFSWIILVIANVFFYMWIFVMPVSIEKKALKRIERLFTRKELYITPNKTWRKGQAINRISKFHIEYEKILKRVDIDDLKEIRFGCILEENENNISLANNRIWLIRFVVLGILVAYGFVLGIPFEKPCNIMYFFVSVSAGIPLFMADKETIKRNYKYINDLLFFSRWGFYIELKNRKQILYINPYDYSRSVFRKWIISLRRTACFYNLAIHMKYDDAENFKEIGVECLCAYLSDKAWIDKYRPGMLIPLLLSYCLNEDENIESVERIKETIKRIGIEKKEQDFSIKVTLLMLRDMCGNDFIFDKDGYKQKLLELF